MPAHRPFDNWMLLPPSPTGDVDSFLEPPSRDLIWKWIEVLANNPAEGRKLFPGTLAAKNRLWREFHNYVRQARAYDDGAAVVAGNAGGLLQYYSLLNLAKAELLITNAVAVTTQPLRHGLLFRRTAGDRISGDAVEVTAGVFPLLYEKRTGHTLPTGTRLPVKRLLAHVPEIGWELDRVKTASSLTGGVVQAIVSDANEVWSLLLCTRLEAITTSRASATRLNREYERVDTPANWRDVFGFTRRNLAGPHTTVQSKWKLARLTPGGSMFTHEYFGAAKESWLRLSGLLDVSTDPAYDAMTTPSFLKTSWMPMPASIARYALMFYLSSVVRYAPTKLDPQRQAEQAWLFDSFAGESHIPLLTNALNGMSGNPVHFYPVASQRT